MLFLFDPYNAIKEILLLKVVHSTVQRIKVKHSQTQMPKFLLRRKHIHRSILPDNQNFGYQLQKRVLQLRKQSIKRQKQSGRPEKQTQLRHDRNFAQLQTYLSMHIN